jgi:hypothetical protein
MKPRILFLRGGDGKELVEQVAHEKDVSIGIALTVDGEHGPLLVSLAAFYCDECDDFHVNMMLRTVTDIAVVPGVDGGIEITTAFPVPDMQAPGNAR